MEGRRGREGGWKEGRWEGRWEEREREEGDKEGLRRGNMKEVRRSERAVGMKG